VIDMELILISDSKLKVMLSAEDMRRYDLNCEKLEDEDAASRRAFWNILDEARQRTGFDPAGERVFVQLYPSKSGGCEMFVTKLGLRTGRGEKKNVLGTGEIREIHTGEKERTEYLYRFTNLEELLQACRRMQAEVNTPSLAYTDEARGGFYLLLGKEISYIAEYNGTLCSAIDHGYIREHCRCFSHDAVRMLSAYA